MEQHPLSAAFPTMSCLELGDLTNDIRTNGQRQPIVILDGMILDGWHRFQACETLHLEPITADLPAGVDPVAFVQSMNMHRRHLTASQRAGAVTACGVWARSGENQHSRGGEVTAPPLTVQEMAKAADVSERTIQQAKAAHCAGLGGAVRDGKVTVERAAEIAKLPEPERKAALAAPKASKTKTPKAKLPDDVRALKALLGEREAEIRELSLALGKALEEIENLRLVISILDPKAS